MLVVLATGAGAFGHDATLRRFIEERRELAAAGGLRRSGLRYMAMSRVTVSQSIADSVSV